MSCNIFCALSRFRNISKVLRVKRRFYLPEFSKIKFARQLLSWILECQR